MKSKNKFFVIIENCGKRDFEPYDILPYLSNQWSRLSPKGKQEAKADLKKWVDGALMYQYWSRCEYEILLSCWPPSDKEDPKKVDIYWQAKPNLDIITRLFSENEGIA